MKRADRSLWLQERAPVLTGAIFCAVIAILSSSCGKKSGTPDWDTPASETASSSEPEISGTPAPVESPSRPSEPAPPPAQSLVTDAADAAKNDTPSHGSLKFMAYNVENWLTMDRFVDNKPLKNSPKPDSEKKALIEIVSKQQPDIIGLCEIGEATDLAEIQTSLKAAGLDLPHSHYTGGSDSVRHLGLLSRFPILSTAKPAEVEFKMRGQSYAINRGILDATVSARGKSYRFIGVHLKSKRAVDEFDQEEMRIHEARLLRRHVDSILSTDPKARLVVYGDFNDTRPTRTFKAVTGSYNDPGYLTAIPFKDKQGDAWTHHWAPHDIYSRIDFVLVSRALRPEVDFRKSYLVDDSAWHKASDHRALMAVFK